MAKTKKRGGPRPAMTYRAARRNSLHARGALNPRMWTEANIATATVWNGWTHGQVGAGNRKRIQPVRASHLDELSAVSKAMGYRLKHRYSRAMLRKLRAERGVGRPPARAA